MNNKSSRNRIFLVWIFVLIPIFVIFITESFKTFLVWRIRIVDFVDLVFIAPFYLIVMLNIINTVFYENINRKHLFLSLGFLGIMLYGHAMHLVGNAINTYSTEINHYLDNIPPDSYELIYFFDEILGHIIFFVGLFGSIGLWIIADQQVQKPSWQEWVAGSISGLAYAIALIESSQPWMGIVAPLWLIFCLIISSRQNFRNIQLQLKNSFWARFGTASAIMILIGELFYLIIMGSFIQPSQLGF